MQVSNKKSDQNSILEYCPVVVIEQLPLHLGCFSEDLNVMGIMRYAETSKSVLSKENLFSLRVIRAKRCKAIIGTAHFHFLGL